MSESYLNNNFLNSKININTYEITLNNLPDSLDLDELWNIIAKLTNLTTYKQKVRLYNDTLLFLSNLINRQATQIRDFSNLSNNVLRKFLDKDRIKLIHNILIEMGVLHKGQFWKKGIESILYRCKLLSIKKSGRKYVLEPYNTQQVTIKDKTAIKRVIKACIYFEEYKNENIEKIMDNMKKISINVDLGYEIYNEQMSKPNPDKDLLKRFNDIIGVVKDSNDEKGLWIKRDSKTGRIYTQIGNLDSDCRKALTIDGEEIVEIDLKNCQPNLMTLYYTQKDDMRTQIEKKKWLDIINNDDFYEYLNKRLSKRIKSRKKLKELVYSKIMFGGFWSYSSEIWKVFESEFPIMSMIMRSKKFNISAREVAMQLQRFESRIIIGTVFNSLRISNPEYIICPIHDAFMVKKSQAAEIYDHFKRIFKEMTSIDPILVVK